MNTSKFKMLTMAIGGILSLGALRPIPASAAGPAPPVREDIEWSRLWVTGVNQTNRPHVLLIGDSITEAYSGVVEHELQNEAYVARLATSKSLGDPAFLEEVSLALRNASFRVVHFNNGMHGTGYSEEEYARDFPKLVKLLKRGAPGAKLIIATTTAKRVTDRLEDFDPFNDRIKTRNTIARNIAAAEKIPINDLFQLVENHRDFYSQDGTHFNQAGSEAEGRQVAAAIRVALKQPTAAGAHDVAPADTRRQ